MIRAIGYVGLVIVALVMGATFFPSRTKGNVGMLMGISEYAQAAYFLILLVLVAGVEMDIEICVRGRDVILPVAIFAYLATRIIVVFQFQTRRIKEEWKNGANHTS